MDYVAEFFETCEDLTTDDDLSVSESSLKESTSTEVDVSIVEEFNMSEVFGS